jgi:hypothetical protein
MHIVFDLLFDAVLGDKRLETVSRWNWPMTAAASFSST